MNSRKYGRLEKAIERDQEPISYFTNEYGKIILGIVMLGLMSILYLSHIIKQDAGLNLLAVERTENYKIEQIQFYRLLKENR